MNLDKELKEQILQLQDKPKQIPEVGYWVKTFHESIVKIVGNKDGGVMLLGYGHHLNIGWVKNFTLLYKEIECKATKEEVKKILINRCEELGIWDVPIIDEYGANKKPDCEAIYNFNLDTLWSKYGVVYDSGVFATPLVENDQEQNIFEKYVDHLSKIHNIEIIQKTDVGIFFIKVCNAVEFDVPITELFFVFENPITNEIQLNSVNEYVLKWDDIDQLDNWLNAYPRTNTDLRKS